MEIEKDPVDLFPTEPTDEARQGEETLDLGSKDLIGLYYNTTESLFLLVVFYLLILLPISLVGSMIERRLRYAGAGL